MQVFTEILRFAQDDIVKHQVLGLSRFARNDTNDVLLAAEQRGI